MPIRGKDKGDDEDDDEDGESNEDMMMVRAGRGFGERGSRGSVAAGGHRKHPKVFVISLRAGNPPPCV